MNKMIKLRDLSPKARGILLKAIPYQKLPSPANNPEYLQLFKDFQKETKFAYLNNPESGKLDGFNRFEVAVIEMRRKQNVLEYDAKREHDGLVYKDERDWVDDVRRKDIRDMFVRSLKNYMKEAMDVR